uniref:Replication-associated protein n=1 Tax=Cressdnaviricota sp. TaxID=2748378 RepID=A0A890UPN0_9VIRU|nr:MAG: replication-associated protein [Cressdnaviricota sp.]
MPRTSGTDPFGSTSGTKPKSKKDTPCRQWTFTLNNYTPKEIKKVHNLPDWLRYLAYSEEVGKKGTPHLQGFIYTWDNIRRTKLEIWFAGRAHLEQMEGNFNQNVDYCSKEGKLVEIGDRPQQGARADILSIKRELDRGVEFDVLLQDERFFTIGMRNERSLRQYASMIKLKNSRKLERNPPMVYLLKGESGHGKTPTIKKIHGAENVYSVFDTKYPWYENYAGEPVIVFEDIDHTSAPPIKHFKDITDGWAVQVPVKGRSAVCFPTHVYVTSNEQMTDWYPGQVKHLNAIKNRFDEVWDFKEEFEYGKYQVVYKNTQRRGNVLPEDGRQEKVLSDSDSANSPQVQSGDSEEETDEEVHERT